MRVDGVEVAPGRVRLPDFDELAAERFPPSPEHAALDDDALSLRVAVVLAREVGIGQPTADWP